MESKGTASGHMTNAPGTGGPVSTIPPTAFRTTPSGSSGHGHGYQQQPASFSPRPPGSLSPQAYAAQSSAYTSPVLNTHSAILQHAASPQLASASSSSSHLHRSQSLGQAAQQYQGPGSSQQHMAATTSVYPAASAMSYSTAREQAGYPQQQQYQSSRDTPYASSSRPSTGVHPGGTGSSSTLLPSINTQIPSGSFMNTPYSPSSATANTRQAFTADSPFQSRISTGGGGHVSPYLASTASGSRPYSMYEQGKGSGFPAASQYSIDAQQAASGSSQHGSVLYSQPQSTMQQMQHPQQQHQQGGVSPSIGGTVLPMHHSASSSGQSYSESLPLYKTQSSQPLTSPYMPAASPGRLGAPPRAPPQQLDRMSVEPDPTRRRERRGTITSAETAEHEMWREQQARAQQAPPRPQRPRGFRRVRDPADLVVNLEPAQQGRGRRADPSGGYVSPLKAMTAYLHHTYHLVNPSFLYELSFNPRRVLTKPSKPMHNDGHDNEDSDYILYVNDFLGSEESNRYLILDVLGQGTFGQVVKCQNMKTREIVAVKVIKNKPAYFNQSMMEVTILETLNGSWDPRDEHHILRLRDTFIHAKHLCLVFELLSSNLYELIKQNSFRGLSTSLVRVFTTQLLDALTVLNEARLIHCDLKPENILLKTLQTPSIKLVDFGSACHERQVVYSYIQSRFYRSPEVLLGLPYNSAIDMWSLGCIAVELFLGLPLFPGTSEYNQICRIVEMLGLPPAYMLEQGKQTAEFFNIMVDEYGRKSYKLKGLEQYSREHNVKEQPSKRYFQATTLPDIVKTYPMSRKSGKPGDVQKEMNNRTSFIDFVAGLLNMDPLGRWTPQQAKQHPFITGEKFTGPFKPPLSPVNTIARPDTKPGSGNSKHPYGGLPDTPSKASGSRAYHDAAAYSQHLAQQQVYNSTAQARLQQSNNPYASNDEKVASQAVAADHAKAAALQAQSALAYAPNNAMSPSYGAAPPIATLPAQPLTNMPYGSQNRSRSNTMTRMDAVPPQLAKMGLDPGQLSAMQASYGSAGSPTVDAFHRLPQTQQQAANTSADSSSSRLGMRGTMNGHMDQAQQQSFGGIMSPSSPQTLRHGVSPPGQVPHYGSNATLSRLAAQQANRTYAPQQGTGSPQSFSVIVDGQQRAAAMGRTASSTSATRMGEATSPLGTQAPTLPPAAYPNTNARFGGATQGAMGQGMAFDPYASDAGQYLPSTLQPGHYVQQGAGSAFVNPTSAQMLAGQRQPSLPAAMNSAASNASAHVARHSIATASASNFGNAHGMYSPPTMAGASIAPGMLLPTNSAPSAPGYGVMGSPGPLMPGAPQLPSSDGYGGLSDIMFSHNQGAGSPYPSQAGVGAGGGPNTGYRSSSRSSLQQPGLPQYHHPQQSSGGSSGGHSHRY